MATARGIAQLLDGAVDQLEKAAYEIRDLPLQPRSEHIQRIAAALSEIFEIQYHLFALQPELTPPSLKGPFEKPEGAWTVALGHARKAEEGGHLAMAIAIFEWFAKQAQSQEHEKRARAEIERLRAKGAT